MTLIDTASGALERATSTIRGNVERQVKKGTLPAGASETILGRITTATALDAAAESSIVVEAASENPTIKFSIFETLDRIAARCAR